MKLTFKPLDVRGTTFHAVSSVIEGAEIAAFEGWCATELPTAGDQWSRFDHDLYGATGMPQGKRIVLVFSDEGCARRFRSVWCELTSAYPAGGKHK